MSIPQPPNIQVPIIDSGQRATPQFQKFLAELCQTAGATLDARVAALEASVGTLLADVGTINGQVAALNTTVAGHTTHLNALPTSRLTGSKAYNPPNLIALATTTTTISVPGATLGMAAEASFSLDLTGLLLTAYVDSANSVTAVLLNPTAGAIDLANGTIHGYAWSPA